MWHGGGGVGGCHKPFLLPLASNCHPSDLDLRVARITGVSHPSWGGVFYNSLSTCLLYAGTVLDSGEIVVNKLSGRGGRSHLHR
jgi:hypothetical protein